MSADIRSINAIRADKEGDNSLLSPVECLEDAAADIRSGVPCDKLMVLMLNTADGRYGVRFAASNMRASEMLAALEVAKARVLRHMNYVVAREDVMSV